MYKQLYIIQNLMIFMEECFVCVPQNNDFYTLNPYYVRNESTFNALKTDISRMFPGLKYMPFSEIGNDDWNRIYISSYAPKSLLDDLSSVMREETILVEDGLFDYVSPSEDYTFYKGKKLFLFRPELASCSAHQSDIHTLVVSDDIIGRFNSVFEKELDKLSELDKETMVLFTTPFEEDFNSARGLSSEILEFIEKTFAPEKLILKRHPRDNFVYESSSIQIIECNQNIPGQLLDKRFDGLKVFLFPSTVSFMCGELSDIVFINVLPDNAEYNKAFRSIVDSDLFDKQKHIKILNMQ